MKKKSLLLVVSAIGISTLGFGQTVETESAGTVVNKTKVSETEVVYTLRDNSTGLEYVSLPMLAKLAIGEHASFITDGTDKLRVEIQNGEEIVMKNGMK